MTKIKLCGLSRLEDIEVANSLKPEYIGFVFWDKSKRNVSYEKAKELRSALDSSIKSVGVFVKADIDFVCRLLTDGIIDIAQLHGGEDEEYIALLRSKTDKPIIQAFRIEKESDIDMVNASSADYVLLDSGKGTGIVFNWELIKNVNRPFFLAGGLSCDNIEDAVKNVRPFAVDVSSGIETDGLKDKAKMERFVSMVRNI